MEHDENKSDYFRNLSLLNIEPCERKLLERRSIFREKFLKYYVLRIDSSLSGLVLFPMEGFVS